MGLGLTGRWPSPRSRRAVGAVAALVVLGGLVAGVAGPTDAQEPEDPLPEALVELQSCVQERGRLSVLFLIDESGSLSGDDGTDPDDQRVIGMKAALGGMLELADVGGGDPGTVDARFMGFSGDTETLGDWTTYTSDTIGGLDDVADQFRERDDRQETDYRTALVDAQAELADHLADVRSETGAASCAALIFFTDGRYEVLGGDVAAGTEELCADGGVVDGLRGLGVVTLAFSLSSGLDGQAIDFLDAVASGGTDPTTCGADGSPRTGVHIPIADAEDLFFALGLGRGQDCTAAAATFSTVAGLRSFEVLARLAADGSLSVRGPEGDPSELPRGEDQTIDISGAQVTARWVSDSQVSLSGDFGDGDAWVGGWEIGFGADARCTLELRSALGLALPAPGEVRLGDVTDVEALLVGSDGDGASGPLVEGAEVSLDVTDPSTGSTTAVDLEGDGPRRTGQWEAPSESSASQLRFDLRAVLPPVEGQTVTPVARSFTVPTLPPAEFGHVEPRQIDLPAIRTPREEPGSARTEVTLVASEVADGCAWVESIDLGGPSDVTIDSDLAGIGTSEGSCLSLPQGSRQPATLTVTPSRVEDGPVSGTLRIAFTSEAADGVRTTDVDVNGVLARQRDAVRVALFVAGLILVSVLVPLLILHLINWITGRLSPPHRVRGVAHPVVVRPEGVHLVQPGTAHAADRPRPGQRLAFEAADLTDQFTLLTTQAGRRPRRIDALGLSFRTHASGSLRLRQLALFSGPFATVTGRADRPLRVGALRLRRPLRTWSGGRVSRVPLALRGVWVFERGDTWADDDGVVSMGGRLVLFMADGAGLQEPAELVREVHRVLPDTLPADPTAAPKEPPPRPGPVTRVRDLVGRLRPGRDDRRDDPPPRPSPPPPTDPF